MTIWAWLHLPTPYDVKPRTPPAHSLFALLCNKPPKIKIFREGLCFGPLIVHWVCEDVCVKANYYMHEAIRCAYSSRYFEHKISIIICVFVAERDYFIQCLYLCCEGPQRRSKKGHWALVSGTSVAPSQHALPMLSLFSVHALHMLQGFYNCIGIEMSRVELDIVDLRIM